MEQLMRFFSPEAGQRRRTALEQLVSGVEQFVPPNLRPAAEAVVQMNPVQGISDAMSASGVVFDPEQTAEARRRAAVDMGVEMAMTLAPAALVRMGYLAAPAGLMETFATPSVDAAVDMGRNALSDAQYAVRSVAQGDPRGVIDAIRPSGQPQSLSAAAPKSGPTFEEAPMIVQHNISPEGLAISDQIGGIPMPSIGIAGAKAPLENFGDITLLLDPQKIAPRRDLPVYPADAYTGRQPRAFREFVNENAAEKAIANDKNFKHMKDANYWMMSYDNFEDNDRMMRIAQYGMKHKIANPKDYDRFDDYVRDVERKMGGFIDSDELLTVNGLRDYGETELKIAPSELFTPSGNRRDPKPYTVEEAFKRMNKDKAFAAGAEMHHGAGQIRAVLLDKFKNLDDIKSKRGLLMPSGNEMEDIKGSFDTMAYDEINDIAEKYFGGRHRAAEDYVTDIAMGQSVSWADAPEGAKQAANEALTRLKNVVKDMPTEYFEAKPRSVAQIGDFDAAVVPEGNQEALEILRRAGVSDIRTYGEQPGQTRADVIRQFKDLMFAVPAGGLLGYNMLPQQQASPNDQGLLY
jgi:hypothetical protein